MKSIYIFIGGLLINLLLIGCTYEESKNGLDTAKCEKTFFGDSTAVFILNKPQNGYNISFIQNKQLALMHFERGDSISRYCAIHVLPDDLRNYTEDSIGVFNVDVEFPVICLDTLAVSQEIPCMFFMDMNFDGEEEFVIKHSGYNRFYYACFDLVNGNWNGSCPGILEPTNEPPYNNIVSGIEQQPSYTVFDRKKKEIYIYETSGCCSLYKTWAKFVKDEFGFDKGIKVVRKEHHDWWSGEEHIKIYKLQNDSLKLVEEKVVNY